MRTEVFIHHKNLNLYRMFNKIASSIANNWKESLIIICLLILSALVHGYNMFGYPAYFDDEGTYSAYGWAVINNGELSHYTYWYDHPPLGWIQLALWSLLTGGYETFGFAINSGRAFVFILAVLSTFLIYRISRNFHADKFSAFFGSLMFAISPLAISMNRMIFLDNIMAFWVLLAIFAISFSKTKIRHVVASGTFLSIAILSKETALVFAPLITWFIFSRAQKHQKHFSLIIFLFIVCSISSLWFIYALLNGELFPPGFFFTDPNSSHVSLFATIQEQLGRGGHGSIFTPDSDIRTSIYRWTSGRLSLFEGVPDVLLLSSGFLATTINLFYGLLVEDARYKFVSLLSVFFILFLIRGGIVLVFYIICLFPLFAINISLCIQILIDSAKYVKNVLFTNFAKLVFIILSLFLYFSLNFKSLKIILFSNQTNANISAVDWVIKNIPKSKIILVDDYAYIDLRNNNFLSPNPVYYWKAQKDPEVYEDILKKDWRNIDYLLTTPSFRSDIKGLDIIKQAFQNSTKIKSFEGDNYYAIEIYQVNKTTSLDQMLELSWNSYIKTFLQMEGRVVDPATNLTTSEGQSYALLRSVWIDDKEIFDKVWQWTRENIQNEYGTFAWKYGLNESGDFEVLDQGTATDADTDIALALLMASKRWNDPEYEIQALHVLEGVWNTEVKQIVENNYITPGNWAKEKRELIINPSYLSPYAYRIFAEVDKKHDWLKLVDTSYELLSGCTEARLDEKGETVLLPPNWCSMSNSKKFGKSTEVGLDSTQYSYDALRSMWRIALDYKWYSEERAKNLLEKSAVFLESQWNTHGKILVGYTHDGKPWEEYESALGYTLNLANFAITDPAIAERIYKEQVLAKYYENFEQKEHYWEDKNNYYTQNWAWFGTALYHDKLPNVWEVN